MGSVSKLFLFVFIHILHLNSFDPGRLASGATIFSPNNVSNSQPQKGGCILILPSDHKYAPSVTDQKTHEQLIPIQGRAKGWHLKIEEGREIKISCGRGNPLTDHGSYLLLSCVRGTEFLNSEDEDEQILLPEGVQCLNPRKPTPIVYRNGTCSGKGTNFDVEFITESPPRKFYSACMDEKTSGALYSSSYIDGESFARGLVESSRGRPDFRGQEFYPFPIKQAYKWENTYEHLSELIGSSDLVDEYFPTDQFRFSRGHLFPNGDGVKRFEKHATFYYMNTVPQWQILNGGNWAIIEHDVRNYAKSLSRTLQVVTGSFGVTTLKDGNNNDVELYLARDDDTGKLRLPVPRLVWKTVHDPVDNAAVAIVQINNPWVQRDRDIVCNDVCSSLPWIRSSGLLTKRRGYTYCCDVNELRRTISYIPNIKYDKLLGVKYSNNDDYNYDNDSDSDSSEDEEDEIDNSSSSDSDSAEMYQNSDTLLEQSLTALFASIKVGVGS